MNLLTGKARVAGLLIIVGMLAGILSVAPSVDSEKYLTDAAKNANQVILAALSQFIMGSVWGVLGAFLSIVASILVLFNVVNIITSEYILLNVPTGLQELVLAVWLIVKGFDKKVLIAEK